MFIPTGSEHQHIFDSKAISASGLLVYITVATATATTIAIAININVNINININILFIYFFISSPHELLLLFPTLVIKSDMKSFCYQLRNV